MEANERVGRQLQTETTPTLGIIGLVGLSGIVGALAGLLSCATVETGASPSRATGPDRCAMMSCPSGTMCVPNNVGGASCQPEPPRHTGLPRLP